MRGYLPTVDGFRAVAVTAVLVFHLRSSWLPGGFVGVDVFFVISGYLITSQLVRELDGGTFSLVAFYQRRIARLVPMAALVGVVTTLFAGWLYARQDYASVGSGLSASILSIVNMKYIFQGSYFEISEDTQPFLHYWSLSLEEQFYLIFPAGILLVAKLGLRRHLVQVMALGALFSFAAGVVVSQRNAVWAFYSLPTRAWELLLGGLVALLVTRSSAVVGQHSVRRWSAAAGVLLVVGSIVLFHGDLAYPGVYALAPTVGACLLLAGGMHVAPLSAALSARSLVWVGKRSYSIYLWHWPVYSFVDFGLYDRSFVARAALKVVATGTLSVVGYRMWENPLRLFLVRPRHRAVAFGGLVCLVLALGLWGRNIRSENYLDLDESTIASGGHFVPAPTPTRGTVMLMGDSHAVMYATGLRDLALEEGYDFRTIAVTALSPFPSADATQSTEWLDSIEAVRERQPAVLVYVLSWQGKAADASEQIRQAAWLLRAETDRLILITQPPVAPAEASRESMREGAAGPFAEDSQSAAERASAHQSLLELQKEGIEIVDLESLFTEGDGSVRILDDEGRFLYQDRSHLTSDGAQLVLDQIRALGIL